MPHTDTITLDRFPITRITLRGRDCTAVVTDLGARLLEFHAPDRDGRLADVVLGRASIEDTYTDRHYMGATAGRYAGRIARGKFSLDGTDHQLATNEGTNHLHGGDRGFDQHVWSTTVHPDAEAVTFIRVSADGEEGFPGALTTAVTYRLEGNALFISMTATTDRATIVRLVNHSYFNLAGHDSGTILDHVLQLNSSHYVVTDEELLPSGEIAAVSGTPYDFRTPRRIGERIDEVENTGAGRMATGSAGYDNSWVLDGPGFRVVGTLTDPGSGRRLELATDQRALCLYAGGYLAGYTAKGELAAYQPFAGVTLETTAFPDDINQPHFPSPILRPGETYRHEMRLTFTAE
jgi:aldose 1-epimerase